MRPFLNIFFALGTIVSGNQVIPLTPTQLTCSSDVVVVGELAVLEDEFMTVSFGKAAERQTLSYNLGQIVQSRVLKSNQKLLRQIPVLFDPAARRRQGKYKKGEVGIWYLSKDHHSGHLIIRDPFSPAPELAGPAIEKLLKADACKDFVMIPWLEDPSVWEAR